MTISDFKKGGRILFDLFTQPRESFMTFYRRCFMNNTDDREYIENMYHIRFGRRINLDNPRTFNEKLNWLKLYNRQPIYSLMADKYEVKSFVANRIGAEYVVENYGVYDCWDDIDFDALPSQFVIKGTHDSGGAFVCKDKATFNYPKVRMAVEKNLRTNYFYPLREWPYKNIKPRIIVDRFLDDHTGKELRDYKWWCFNGKPVYMYCTIKGKDIFENFYDMDFNLVNIDHGFPRHQPEFNKPSQFGLMKSLAEILSEGIPFVRIDFFVVKDKVFFGEFTFYDWGGMRPFAEYEQDLWLGELIVLPEHVIC